MNLNHNESLFTAIYYEDCLALANYLNQNSPELWGRLERLCAYGLICSQKDTQRESKNRRTRLHGASWKTPRVEAFTASCQFWTRS